MHIVNGAFWDKQRIMLITRTQAFSQLELIQLLIQFRDEHAAAFSKRELEEAEEISTTEVSELTLRLSELEVSYRETEHIATTAAMLCSELQAHALRHVLRRVALKKIIESSSALTSLTHTRKGMTLQIILQVKEGE